MKDDNRDENVKQKTEIKQQSEIENQSKKENEKSWIEKLRQWLREAIA